MNFLSHYFVEGQPEEPLFASALLVPDLVSGFTKVYNQHIRKNTMPLPVALQWVNEGIVHHYVADRKFHNSRYFTHACQVALQEMLQAGLNRNQLRLSVLAHLAVELLLDRALLLQQPESCDRLYAVVEKADEELLQAYFNWHGLEHKNTVFLDRFRFFKHRKYIYLFSELKNLVLGMERIYKQATGVAFTDDENKRMEVALYNIDGYIRYNWQQILNLE